MRFTREGAPHRGTSTGHCSAMRATYCGSAYRLHGQEVRRLGWALVGGCLVDCRLVGGHILRHQGGVVPERSTTGTQAGVLRAWGRLHASWCSALRSAGWFTVAGALPRAGGGPRDAVRQSMQAHVGWWWHAQDQVAVRLDHHVDASVRGVQVRQLRARTTASSAVTLGRAAQGAAGGRAQARRGGHAQPPKSS